MTNIPTPKRNDSADASETNQIMSNPSPTAKNSFYSSENHDEQNFYLLVKNIPENFTKNDIFVVFMDVKSLIDILIKKGNNNVYLKMTDIKELTTLLETSERQPLQINGVRLRMTLLSKIPLDLNRGSRILLLTIYNETLAVNVKSMYDCFSEFGEVNKIIIFKKKNYQLFLEFAKTEDAFLFQQSFDATDFKGFFFLRIQFTQKSYIVVHSNNTFEHDFTNKKKSGSPMEYEGVPPQKSLSNISECNELSGPSPKMHFQGQKPYSENLTSVHVTELNPEITHKQLFNLFSLYGNIEKISLSPKTTSARIFYSMQIEHLTAFQHLKDLKLFGNPLKMELGNISIQIEKKEQFQTVFYKKSEQFGLEKDSKRLKTLNRPSHILYIFNLTKSVGLEVIQELFSKAENVIDIYYLNESRNSALCYFESIEAAVRILCNFKNINLIDKSLKINFAHDSPPKTDPFFGNRIDFDILAEGRDIPEGNKYVSEFVSREELGPNRKLIHLLSTKSGDQLI